MSLGPVMLDVEGACLTAEDKEVLRHPATGGVILFTRNFENRQQLGELCDQIHALRKPHMLIGVDQEGGRVQRFRGDFTPLPPAGHFGRLYDADPAKGRRAAELAGWLMASELRAAGVDFSFAPVLDLGLGISQVIGDRAFHARPMVVADLAKAWTRGMHNAGMAAVGKHFPGHGHVEVDSHASLPIDTRRMEELLMEDLIPFERLIQFGIEAIMPAHVVYENVDRYPAGFSSFWLKQVLRKQLGFQGVIFSDDLSMGAAAESAGTYAKRAEVAIAAGCDIVLVCNNRAGAVEVLEDMTPHDDPAGHLRAMRMHGRKSVSYADIQLDPKWKPSLAMLAQIDDPFELTLDI